MPSPQDYTDAFEKAFNEGYDEILHIGLSFNISNALNSATVASKEFKDKEITIYDCGVMGPSQGVMVLMADKILKNGKSVEDAVKFLDSMKGGIYGIGCSSSFDILFKTGRVKKGAGITIISKLLRLKPLFELNFKEGVVGLGGGKGYKDAIKMIISNIQEKTDDNIEYDLIMGDAIGPNLMKKLEDEIVKVRKIRNIYYWPIVPMMAHTLGKGCAMATLGPTLEDV
jgi:DegV family protein with EDD domain